MRKKNAYAGSFRLEPATRADLETLHASMGAHGWETRPLEDSDKAMYGLFMAFRARGMSSAHAASWGAVRRIIRQSGIAEPASVTIKVLAAGGSLDPDDVDGVDWPEPS